MVLITRPLDESAAFAAQLAAVGIDSLSAPALVVEDLDVVLPDLTGFDALLVTSARALRLFAAQTADRHWPVFAVGPETAQAARALGFASVQQSAGDSAALVSLVQQRLPKGRALLHPRGAAVAGEPAGLLTAAGWPVTSVVLYRTQEAAALPAAACDALRSGQLDAVTFFSGRSAEAFGTLVAKAGLQSSTARLDALCLSQAVATAAAALTWRRIFITKAPNRDAMVECCRSLR